MGRQNILASWTGTMFEYLMPALWMRLYSNTLLDRSARAAVQMQRMYAARFRVPWGISESGWSEQSAEGHYQYRAFGVPTIALKNPTEAAPAGYFAVLLVARPDGRSGIGSRQCG